MDDQKKYTEEDMQRARREGYVAGAAAEREIVPHRPLPEIQLAARYRYPIKKRVPREVKLADALHVRADGEGGVTFVRSDPFLASRYGVDFLTASDVQKVNDLLARPYEEVEE